MTPLLQNHVSFYIPINHKDSFEHFEDYTA